MEIRQKYFSSLLCIFLGGNSLELIEKWLSAIEKTENIFSLLQTFLKQHFFFMFREKNAVIFWRKWNKYKLIIILCSWIRTPSQVNY